MAFLSKEKIKEIVKKRPLGTSPEAVIKMLLARGHILEGYQEVKKSLETPVLTERQNKIKLIEKRLDELTKEVEKLKTS